MRANTYARAAGLALCLSVPTRAQTPAVQVAAATYALSGTVVDRSGTPVPGAEVTVVHHDTATWFGRSDANGRFRFDALDRPADKVRVRRLGYRVAMVAVPRSDGARTATVFVTLDPMPAELDAVHVDDEEAGGDLPDARLIAFHDRARSNNFGHYVDEDALAKLHPHFASEALRNVPGVLIRPSRRIGNVVRLRNCGVAGESNEKSGPLVWVDGVRMPNAELDEAVQGSDVAAIEIYSSFAGIPAQFFDRTAVCGTIVVWTKNR